MQTVKSPKKIKPSDAKRTKSKSKLNLIKSKEKESVSKSREKILKKNESGNKNIKNIYTYRSPEEDKRSVSRSQYQSNKGQGHITQEIKKYNSPELMTINESKKRLKTQLSDKSR
jgi:3-hydroxyacyl-CoA dehydrogenase